MNITMHEFFSPIVISLKVVALSSTVVFLLGIAAAWRMTRKRVAGRLFVDTLFMLPLVLPPTVVGFLTLVAIGRKSPFGRFFESFFGEPLVFSWWAALLAAVIMAFPLVYQTLKAGFSSVDRDLEDAARSYGSSEWQVFRHITLPLAGRSVAAAYLLGFARGLGEFGATLMVAGNIPGKTQTVPTAIYLAVDSGRMALAWSWTAAMILFSFAILAVVHRKLTRR